MFHFKQFALHHARNGMKIGTDGVLLGAWSTFPPNITHILDIGTGTGLLAFMLAQRFPHAHITGLEPHPINLQEAEGNLAHNTSFPGRIKFVAGRLQDYAHQSGAQFDGIICNPPFYQEKLQAEDPQRNMARNLQFLPPEDLFLGAQKLLKPGGVFNLIIPAELKARVLATATKTGFSLQTECSVQGRSNKPIKRYLLQFVLGESAPRTPESLVLEKAPRESSEAHLKLVQPFLLD
ncbi:MAG: tRNA1Val (adenine37-N6)-methyltransferase [Luteibaculaceae bacterium]